MTDIPKGYYEGIGGSMCAAIMGLDRHKSPYDAWLQFTDPSTREDLSTVEHVRWGQLLERTIGEEAALRLGIAAAHQPDAEPLRHPMHPFMQAHLDFRVFGESALLECKNRGLQMMKEYDLISDDVKDEDRVLPSEAIQVHHYLTVTGFQRAYLAVLIGGQRLLTFTIERDEAISQKIIAACTEFWNLVQTRTPPPPINLRDVNRMFPTHAPAKVLDADDELAAKIGELQMFKKQVKALEEHVEWAELAVKSAVKDAEEVRWRGEKLLTWKNNRDSQRLDEDALKAKHPDAYADCLVTRAGARVMRLSK